MPPRKITESLKTLFLLLLIAAMIALVVLNLSEMQRGRLFSGREFEFDKLWITQSGQTYKTDVFDPTHITPAFVGIRLRGGGQRGTFSGTNFIRDLFNTIMPCLNQSLCADAEILNENEGNALWTGIMDENDYIYVKFQLQLPSAFIYAHSASAGDISAESGYGTVSAMIYEMFILLNHGASRGIAGTEVITRSIGGEVARFSAAAETGGYMFELTSLESYYANSRMKSFVFANQLTENSGSGNIISSGGAETVITSEGADVSPSLPVFEGLLEIQKIEYDPEASFIYSDGGAIPSSFISLMNFNPDKLSENPAPGSGSVLHVETHGTIRAQAYSLQYTALPGGGIFFPEFLAYQKTSEQYNIFDAIKAGESFVNAFRLNGRGIIGGDAHVGLTGLYYDEDTLIMEYSYFYENIRIENKYDPQENQAAEYDPVPESVSVNAAAGFIPAQIITAATLDERPDLPAIRLEIKGERITSAEINSRAVQRSGDGESVIMQPQYWLLGIAALPESKYENIRDMRICYTSPAGNAIVFSPVWSITDG